MDGSEFFKPISMYPLWPSVFSFGTFLSVALSESRCIFSFESSSSPCNFFSVLFIYSAFLLCFLCSHILLQNCCFPVIRLLVCLRAFSSYLRVGFLSLFWNVPFCLYCLIPSFLLSPVPPDLFPRVSLVVLITMLLFLFSSQHILGFFLCLIIFACCRFVI